MRFYKLFLCAVAGVTLICSCSSDKIAVSSLSSSGLSINDKAIYLRGEMNDYEVSETYRLRKTKSASSFCTLATLRSDWAPYKFKFADEDWSNGSNFGFLTPPGILREGAKAIELNPNSKFEEISFYPKADGVYRFCLVQKNDKFYVLVSKSSRKELPTMAQLIKLSSNVD